MFLFALSTQYWIIYFFIQFLSIPLPSYSFLPIFKQKSSRSISSHTRLDISKKNNPSQSSKRYINITSSKTTPKHNRNYQFTYDPPPFYPLNLDDLVADSVFSLKTALISRFNRIRIDIDTRLSRHKKDIYMMEWLILFSFEMVNTEFTRIHIFVNDLSSIACLEALWNIKILQVANSTGMEPTIIRSCITVSPLTDLYLKKDDKLIIIYNPNNIVTITDNTTDSATSRSINILEEVQALCFHSALRNIPVVIINPSLIATAWNDYGAREPSLLQDFAQAYSITDEYFMFGRDSFCGVVQRASAGLDVYLLSGFSSSPGKMFPMNYTRIESSASGAITSMDNFLTKELARQPDVVENIETRMRRANRKPEKGSF